MNYADRVFKSWIHESIHARHAYATGAAEEYIRHRGFEEGLVEGLTQYVLECAGIVGLGRSFDYFVSVYEQLASVLEIEAVDLWRELWAYPMGEVRDAVVTIVTNLHQVKHEGGLTRRQRLKLFAAATSLLNSAQDRDSFDRLEIQRIWKDALDERP